MLINGKLSENGFGADSKFVEIINPRTKDLCRIQDYPVATWGSAGGLLGNKPTVCGGVGDQNGQCYSLSEEGNWVAIDASWGHQMWVKAYVSIGNKMLVFGGREKINGQSTIVQESLWIRPDGTTGPGPDLDEPIAAACATLISDPNEDDVEVAVIGGSSSISGDWKAMTVYNCNWKTEVCTKSVSKSMQNIFGNARYAVSCGQMLTANNKRIALSMGHSKENGNRQVLALDLTTAGAQWTNVEVPSNLQRKKVGLDGKFSVLSDLKTGYWSLGTGHITGDGTNMLYEVTCQTATECEFTELDTEKVKRAQSVALMVPNSGLYQCPTAS